MLVTVVAGAVFFLVLAAIGMVVAGLGAIRQARGMELSRRMGPRGGSDHQVVIRRIDDLGLRLGPIGNRLHLMTVQAGEGSTVTQLVSSSSIAAVTGVMAAWFLFGGWGTLLGLLPGFLPLAILQRRIQVRSMKVTEQLPEALDLISRALRAGHAFNDALRTAGAELPAPLGAELTHTSEEHRLGLSMRGCLDNLVERLPDNFEMRFFVSSVMLQRETGGNLVEILETISETVRERVIFEGKVEALTAEVRMSALILQLLPVGAAVILFIMEPQYLMPLIEPGLGRTMLGAAVALMATGSYVMRRISTVEF